MTGLQRFVKRDAPVVPAVKRHDTPARTLRQQGKNSGRGRGNPGFFSKDFFPAFIFPVFRKVLFDADMGFDYPHNRGWVEYKEKPKWP
jgi:hypothetical protein